MWQNTESRGTWLLDTAIDSRPGVTDPIRNMTRVLQAAYCLEQALANNSIVDRAVVLKNLVCASSSQPRRWSPVISFLDIPATVVYFCHERRPALA